MQVVFDSRTNNVRRFIDKVKAASLDTGIDFKHISEYKSGPFLLVTYTTGRGQTPVSTTDFLKKYGEHMTDVVSSGNRNWGLNYAKAADNISEEYGVPILMKFEVAGTSEDVGRLKDLLHERR